jgi:sulfotransferase
MKKSTLHFISGLPRSGSTLITNILKQNPKIHGDSVSSLSTIFGSIHSSWNNFNSTKQHSSENQKRGVLNGILEGYYSNVDKPVIIDKDIKWVSQVGQLEAVLDRQVKMVICVRNPAEILTSFEKLHKENPLFLNETDVALREGSSIASRAYHYAAPEGIMGRAHRNLKDAMTMGYLDRFLFIDYSRYCNSPKSQTKRIYDFLELEHFEHDFKNIEQEDFMSLGLPTSYKLKPTLQKTTVNCVEYLGLDLYEQYNREIFWNAWI